MKFMRGTERDKAIMNLANNAVEQKPAHIFVIGNEKGGSGKSTTSMHLIVALLREGHRVATIDLDARQATLTRYIENRKIYAARKSLTLPHPDHTPLLSSSLMDKKEAQRQDNENLENLIQKLSPSHDFIVIDTPGSDSFLGRAGHSYANTLITPINDSFIDLDILGTFDPETYEMIRPSHYAQMVFETKIARAKREQQNRNFDWIVMRNRLGHVESRNQKAMLKAINILSKRLAFRTASGFSERVVFRELFLKGLTLLDLKDVGKKSGIRMGMSHIAARQEIRTLLEKIGLSPSF